jgi:ACS family hexuronate transporter-like MFS transporter
MANPVPAVKAEGDGTSTEPGGTIGNLRWYICGILFLATTINYLDRQSVSVLKELLQSKIGWDEAGYGWINFAFQVAYAIMFVVSGRLLDVFGVRAGMTWAVTVWSLAAMAHAFTSTPFGFASARFVLGLGEAANFPASIKAVAEWFPKRERALATGIFNSGTNVAVILAFTITWLAETYNWQSAFVAVGALGFVWLAGWLWLYRSPETHPKLSEEERALILSDKQDAPGSGASVPWTALLRYPQAWAFLIPKMLTDPVWWFYLLWLPGYLNRERGLSLTASARTMAIPYIAASIGSIAGGWLSGYLIKSGWTVGRARLLTMGIFAFCMPAAILAVSTESFTFAVVLISLATASHQAWSANVFTMSSDMFPKSLVGSVVGLGGMCGAIGGMFMTLIAGGVLQWFGSYKPLFILAGIMHPLAFFLVLAFVGREFKQADVETRKKSEFSPALAATGAVVALLGTAGAVLVWTHWQFILDSTKHSLSTAAGGLTGSIGVAILGLALLYASRAQNDVPARA